MGHPTLTESKPGVVERPEAPVALTLPTWGGGLDFVLLVDAYDPWTELPIMRQEVERRRNLTRKILRRRPRVEVHPALVVLVTAALVVAVALGLLR